jgi:hypothetical protein
MVSCSSAGDSERSQPLPRKRRRYSEVDSGVFIFEDLFEVELLESAKTRRIIGRIQDSSATFLLNYSANPKYSSA